MTPATITAIELAWLEKGRAQDVALRFKVKTNQVRRIWTIAKAEGRILNSKRRRGGYDLEEMLRLRAQNQSEESHFSITPAHKAPSHALKERAA